MAEKIKDNNYFQISGWMVTRLKLKDKELMIYAIIYSFSQDGESEFSGSIKYLCEFIGAGRTTVINTLKKLVDKELIIKNQIEINGVKFNKYKANMKILEFEPVIQNLDWGGSKIERGVVQKLNGGSPKTEPNNNNNISILNNKKKETHEDIINAKIENEEVKDALMEFVKMRKQAKKPMTNRALTILIAKLNRLSTDSKTQVAILEQSILNNWMSIYPLKGENNVGRNTTQYNAGAEYAEFV